MAPARVFYLAQLRDTNMPANEDTGSYFSQLKVLIAIGMGLLVWLQTTKGLACMLDIDEWKILSI